MKSWTTDVLLTIVAALLVALLMRDSASVAHARQTEPSPPVVRARGFELVDERGEVRAQLYLGEDGGGNIRLHDVTGAVRIKLGASTQGYTGLLVLDETINPAVQIVSDKSGAFMLLAGQGKQKRVIRP